MADDIENAPLFQIQRMYLKDLSLEQPNSPQVLLEQGQPQVEINLTLGAEVISEAMIKLTQRWTVPQIFIGDIHVGGCDELVALDRRGALAPLLAGTR